MKTSSLLLGALAPLALASEGCLNEDFERDPLNIPSAESKRALNDLRARDLSNIDLYLHVLTANTPDDSIGAALVEQVSSLNAWFEPYGFHFEHRLSNFVVSPEWASGIDADKDNKMTQLHRGEYKSLNVYMVESANSGVCSLPDGSGQPISQQSLDGDGCFVPLTAPTSKEAGVMVHEIGHWLGLLHTFQGGCDGDGDYCDDTAPQNGASLGKVATPGDLNSCPAAETCGAGRGLANVKNHVSKYVRVCKLLNLTTFQMDYSDCAHEFTPCQNARMAYSWTSLRDSRALAEGVVVKW